MISCTVYGCLNNSGITDSGILYHPFPKSSLSEQWIQACGWQELPIDVDTAHICSTHFEQNAYATEVKIVDYNVCFTKILKDSAVPTLKLPQAHIIIKQDSLEGIVVYTISQEDTGQTENITIEVEVDTKEDDVLKPQSSSSKGKLQTYSARKKKEVCDKKKYDHIKSQLDLILLQAHNKTLKKDIEEVKKQVDVLEKIFREKDIINKNVEEEYKEIQTKVAKSKRDKAVETKQHQNMILSKVFSQSQIKILLGKKKVAWSNDDMAVGYTIRHLSNKRCYLYLTKQLNIPLPGISSIKRWVTTNNTRKSITKKKIQVSTE